MPLLQDPSPLLQSTNLLRLSRLVHALPLHSPSRLRARPTGVSGPVAFGDLVRVRDFRRGFQGADDEVVETLKDDGGEGVDFQFDLFRVLYGRHG